MKKIVFLLPAFLLLAACTNSQETASTAGGSASDKVQAGPASANRPQLAAKNTLPSGSDPAAAPKPANLKRRPPSIYP